MDNDINTNMIVVNDDPKSCLPRKSGEKASGKLPAKVKTTGLTFQTLLGNINDKKLELASRILNEKLSKVKQGILAEETKIAEERERRPSLPSESKVVKPLTRKEVLEQEALAAVRFQNVIAEASKPEVVGPVLSRCGIELTDARQDFYNNERMVVKSSPKALMITIVLEKICEAIGSRKSLHKEQTVTVPKHEKTSKVANWRALFENITPPPTEEPIAKEEVEPVEMATPIRGVTEEELKDRRLKAQIGDELQEIRRLKESIGKNTPFSSGLSERESTLLGILSQVTGIDIKPKEMELELMEETDLQRLINSITGYKVPLSESEHQEKEMAMQSYYANPEVEQIIDDLRLKNILFDMNSPESHGKILEAERKDNDLRASKSSAIDLLDSFAEEEKMPKKEMDSIQEVVSPLPTQDQKEEIKRKAEEEARLLHAKAQTEEIKRIAEEEARLLHAKAQTEGIKRIAEEEAKLLHAKAQTEEIKRMAEEEAKLLHAKAQTEEIKRMAEEEAKLLHAKAQTEEIKRIAEEEARLLHGKAQTEGIKRIAEEEAKLLHAKAQTEEIKRMAEEEARLLYDKSREPSYIIFDTTQRYHSLSAPSKPIRVSSAQFRHIKGKRPTREISERDTLVSLRDQLDQLGLGEEPSYEIPTVRRVA